MTIYVRIIGRLSLTPLKKISILYIYAFNKPRWRFSIHDLTETWIDKNNKIILKFVMKSCQLSFCANVGHLSFPLSRLGINFKSAKMLCNQCKLLARRILRQSKNPEIEKLYTLTSPRHINHDYLINCVFSENLNQVLSDKQFNSRVLESTVKLTKVYLIISKNKFMNLNEQQ